MTDLSAGRRDVVLHLTECFASGTATAISQYTRNVDRYEHVVLGALRGEAPATTEMRGPFRFVRLPGSKVRQALMFARWVRRTRPAVVHCHSSWAGTYGRVVARLLHVPVVYSPHGMATYRQDVGPVRHALFWAAERALALFTDVYVVAGHNEARLVRSVGRGQPTFVAGPALAGGDAAGSDGEAGAPAAAGEPATRDIDVCTASRISAAKDPRLFAQVVRGLRDRGWRGRCVWIGSGDAETTAALTALGVEVTGWITREEVAAHLRRARVYLDTSAWEASLSYADLEAARAGCALVVHEAPHTFDTDGVTRFGAAAEGSRLLERLLTDDDALAAARARSASLFATDRNAAQGYALVQAYAAARSRTRIRTGARARTGTGVARSVGVGHE